MNMNASPMQFRSKTIVENSSVLREARLQTTKALQEKLTNGDLKTAKEILRIQEQALKQGVFGLDTKEQSLMFSEQKTLLIQDNENQLILEDAIEIKFDVENTEQKREGTVKAHH